MSLSTKIISIVSIALGICIYLHSVGIPPSNKKVKILTYQAKYILENNTYIYERLEDVKLTKDSAFTKEGQIYLGKPVHISNEPNGWYVLVIVIAVILALIVFFIDVSE